MINTELLEYVCNLAILTPYITNEKPVSLMLLAPPEHAKSEILKKLAHIPSVKLSTDFNFNLFAEFTTEYQMGVKRTLIFPDFLKIIKKKYSTQANSLGIINAITEEGWIGKLPMGQIINIPIQANVLTALTKDELTDKRHKWTALGFLSRFVPLSYQYKDKTKDLIRSYIENRIYHNEKPSKLETPKEAVDVTLPVEIAAKIKGIAIDFSKDTNLLGFRLQRQLQTLAMANALLSKRVIVNEDDYKTIEGISTFINFNFNGI